MTNKVIGAGGGKGGGGGEAPSESPDSLRSKQKVRVVEIISEGEIEGFSDPINPYKDVYLDDVPVQNADGTYNFQVSQLFYRLGTPNQEYIPGFDESEATQLLNPLVIKQGVPYTFGVGARSSTSADALRVTIGFPGLSSVTDKGNVEGTSVSFTIEVQSYTSDGAGGLIPGGFVNRLTETVTGKTISLYKRNYRINLPQGETGPWDVRISRTTADSTSAKLANGIRLEDWTIISETKMQYKHSAVVAAEIAADVFPSIPTRGYRMKGIKIQVPSNYDPITRTYTGLWNGGFTTKYSNNPAWILYDIITSSRYGLGKYISPLLTDKWALYSIAKYCDELVPSGVEAGMEPRYTCNVYIQERTDAFQLIANLASIAHVAVYGTGGGIGFVQDAPRDVIALYTPANVIDGVFEYAGASVKAKHNVVLVSWNDPADMFRQKIEYVDDPEQIKQFGVIQTSIVAMGCTSRGQARRFGKSILYAEKFESETITFAAGLDSVSIYPGAVFGVADPIRTEVRNGGRLLAATSTSITIDAPISLELGIAHKLNVIMPDGSVCTRSITTSGTEVTVIEVSAAFSYTAYTNAVPPVAYEVFDVPVNLAIWTIESATKPIETWVCVAMEENSETGNIAISGIAYNLEKHALIESGNPLPATPEYNPYLLSPPPTDLKANSYLSTTGKGIDLLVSWEAAPNTRLSTISWRFGLGEFTTRVVYEESYTIKNASLGHYDIYVSTTTTSALRSPQVYLSHDVTSVAIIPDVTGLYLRQPFIDKFASFGWDLISTADSYKIQIVSGTTTVREVIVTDNWYIYDYAESVADGAGIPLRTFTFRVKGLFGQIESGNWTSLNATNPAPAIPAANVLAITGGFQIYAPLPPDGDYAGMIVWASTLNGFSPTDGYLVYSGANNSANILQNSAGAPFVAGVDLYVRVAFYDVYGTTSLNISSQYTVQPLANVADIAVVNTLPATGTTGQVVFLTTDEKLYRWAKDGIGGTVFDWRTWVDGSDIMQASVTAGKITTTSLSALSGNLGTINAGNITLDAATGFIQGGQTGFNQGIGFYQGWTGGQWKWSLGDPAGQRITWENGTLSVYGTISVNYTDVVGKPTSLAGINTTEGNKLAAIEDGATRNAYKGTYSTATSYLYGDVVTKDGSAWLAIASSLNNPPPTLPTTSNTWWVAYATQGQQGEPGVNGTRTGILDMYIASATVPTVFPSGTSTYTWATGQFTAPATPNGWSVTPPTPAAGEKLYIARQLYSDQLTTSTSSVTWATTIAREAGGAAGADGAPGVNGTRTAYIELYRWAAAAPTTFPSGTSTYTWANGSFTLPATPNGWSLLPGAAVPGQTLWACSTRYADSDTTATTAITWATSTAYSIGAAGTSGANAKLVFLTATSQVFKIDKSLNVSPTSITLTANQQNLTGSPVFAVVSGTANLTGTGNIRDLTAAGMTTDSAMIKVTWDGVEDFVTITKIREGLDGAAGSSGTPGANGADGITVVFSNEAHTLPANNAGSVTNYSNSGTTVQVYEGTSLLTAGGSTLGSFTVGNGVVSPATTITPGTVTYGGQTATISNHSAMSSTQDTLTITFPISVIRLNGTVVSFNKVQSITKSKAGAPGTNGLTVLVSNESHTIPADSTGVVVSGGYVGSGTTITVYEGINLLLASNVADASMPASSFKIGVPTQSPATSITSGAITHSGTTATVADHSGLSNSVSAVTLTYPVTVKRSDGSITTLTKVQSLAKSLAGVAGADGAPGASGSAVSITVNNPAVFMATDNVLLPMSSGVNENLTFTANTTGITSPTYTWSLAGLQGPPTPSTTNTQTITAAQFGIARSAIITCSVSGTVNGSPAGPFTDSITIARLEKSTAQAGADVTTNVLNTGVTITAGGITMGGGGHIKGGQTAYDTGNGFWMGYSGGVHKFSMGQQNGAKITFDGTSLNISGGQSGGNLLTNAGPGPIEFPWLFSGGNGAAPINGAGVDWHPVGGNCLTFYQNNANPIGAVYIYPTDLIPVVAGLPYEFSAYTGAHRCEVFLVINWHDATGTVIGQSFSNTNNQAAGGGKALSGYLQLFGIGVAPAGTVAARYHLGKNSTISGTDSWLFATRCYFGEAVSVSQTLVSPWTPGKELGDYAGVTGTKPPSNADNTGGAISVGTTINGGGITVSGGGSIKGGQSDFHVGNGWFLGYSGGQYKFSIGSPSSYFTWDGTNLEVTGSLINRRPLLPGPYDLISSTHPADAMGDYNGGSVITATPVKTKEIQVGRSGTITVYFSVTSSSSATQSYRIYKNGAAIGTVRSITVGFASGAWSEDFAGILPGDKIQLYTWAPGGSGNSIMRVLSIRCSENYNSSVVQ